MDCVSPGHDRFDISNLKILILMEKDKGTQSFMLVKVDTDRKMCSIYGISFFSSDQISHFCDYHLLNNVWLKCLDTRGH